MDFERKEKLVETGFEFCPDEEKWNSQFKKLQDYHGKHGHCELFWAVDRFTFIFEYPHLYSAFLSHLGKVPCRYNLDPKLGTWVEKQRAIFKKGRMDFERKAKLDEIGFNFNLIEDMWDFQFQKLCEYKEKHGHCELFWAVDCFIFVLNTATITLYLPLYLPLSLHCR
jgi:hypothetical protein